MTSEAAAARGREAATVRAPSRRWTAMVLAVALVTCADAVAPPGPPETSQAPAAEPPRVTSTLRGVVRLRRGCSLGIIDVSRAQCRDHVHEELPIEKYEVNGDGSLPWAFLHLVDGPSLPARGIDSAPVVVRQDGCVFAPHVFGVVAGQEVTFLPAEGATHSCIHLKGRRQEVTRVFDAPYAYRPVRETSVRITTDCRSWMSAWMHVLDHSRFAVSERHSGRYEIAGLIPGRHTFRAWHEHWARMHPVEFVLDLGPGENVHDVELGPDEAPAAGGKR